MFIIDSRLEIIKIIEVFLEDSQIIGNIFRLFRKAVMVITSQEFQKGKITNDINPKQYIKEIKVGLNSFNYF